MDQGIRWYGYDPVSKTCNLLQVLRPDEDLSASFIRGRHISSGGYFVSNTVAAGAFAVAGSFNGITYIALPPITNMNPASLTQYKADDVNVVSSTSAAEGLAIVSPLNNAPEFRVFDIGSTPDWRTDLWTSFYISAGYAFNLSPGPGLNLPVTSRMVFQWTTSANTVNGGGVPAPLPWGHCKIEACVNLVSQSDPNTWGTTSDPLIQTVVYFNSADPADYHQTITSNSFFNTLVWWKSDIGGVNFWLSSTTININLYDEREISEIVIVIAGVGTPGPNVAAQSAFYVDLHFPDYYRNTTKEPGSIVGYQSMTTGQQLSIAGLAHWEVQPNYSLVRNLGVYYNVDDPLKMEAVVFTILSRLGTGLRFVYNRREFQSKLASGYFDLRDDDIVYHAASISTKFLTLLKKVGTAIAKPGIGLLGAGVGALTENPALGAMVTNGGLKLYDSISGQRQYRSSSRPKPHTTMVDSASDAQVDEAINLADAITPASSSQLTFAVNETVITIEREMVERGRQMVKFGVSGIEVRFQASSSRTYHSSSRGITLGDLDSAQSEEVVPMVAPIAPSKFMMASLLTIVRDPLGAAKAKRLTGQSSNVFSEMRTRYGCFMSYSLIPMTTKNEGAVGAFLVISSLPVLLPGNRPQLNYQPQGVWHDRSFFVDTNMKSFNSTSVKTLLRYSDFIKEGLQPDESFYISIVPLDYILGEIEGLSYMGGIASAGVGVPANAFISATMTEMEEITELEDKAAIAIHNGKKIYFFNFDMIDFGLLAERMSKMKKPALAKFIQNQYLDSLNTAAVALGSDDFSVGFTSYVSNSILDLLIGSKVEDILDITPAHKKYTQDAQAKAKAKEESSEYLMLSGSTTLRMTKEDLIHNNAKMYEDMINSGYFSTGQPGADKPQKFEDYIKKQQYRKAAAYWAQWKGWQNKAAGGTNAKKKQSRPPATAAPRLKRGEGSTVFARFHQH